MSLEISNLNTKPVELQESKTKVEKTISSIEKNQTPQIQQQDEYISSEKEDRHPSGLYSLTQEKDGTKKIIYEDPKKKTDNPVNTSEPKKTEECTTDTSKVDQEIEKLKNEKKQYEQQIRAAAGDENKVKELEHKLKQIEAEISQKDNDSYRRQNAVIM